ncbi:MAG: RNA methyltransferase [Bacteroidales bacterium]|jgi:TrmH family RNA methyltransferase
MLSKADIKFLKSLSYKKTRDELGLFIVEGEKMVEEAKKSDFLLERVIYMKDIGEVDMSKITLLSSPSPVFAILKRKDYPESIAIESDKIYLALDSVRDPGNLGTIIRLADWFGIEAIIASEDTVDMYNPKVIQASMGAIFRTKIVYTNLCDFISKNSDKTEIYGTFLNASNIYRESLSGRGIIVIGSESNGISADVESLIKKKLFIPSFTGKAGCGSESLNVAIATAIVCSEFRRSSV